MLSEYWTSMTHGEKLFYVTKRGGAATFAYERLHLHYNAAHTQMARINQAIAAFKPSVPEPDENSTQEETRAYMREAKSQMQPILAEVHFYFVSWSGCRNMLKVLVGQPEFLGAKKVYDRYKREFEHYVAGRNSFEHFSDRLPGQKKKDVERVRAVKPYLTGNPRKIYAGLSEGKYRHSDLEWDISPKSLERLDKYISEVLTVIHAKVDDEFNSKFGST